MIEVTITLSNLSESEYRNIIDTLDEMIERTKYGHLEIEYERDDP